MQKTTIMVCKSQGPRQYMEDRHCAIGGSSLDRPLIVGVFDGHGGDEVATYVSTTLPQNIMENWFLKGDKTPVFATSFLATDAQAAANVRKNMVGTTACVAVVDQLTRTLWVANTGDSRCVLKTTTDVIQMSSDHKPETPQETQRINNSGGFVANVYGVHRVMGNLSVSRSLGDWYMRPFVIPHPGVSSRALHGKESYLLLATDGLWDVFNSKDACDLLDNELKNPKTKRSGALKRLLMEARRRGSQDNITALMVFFEAAALPLFAQAKAA